MSGVDIVLVTGQVKRKALVISAPKVATVWISFVGPAAVLTGIALRPGTAPFVLSSDVFAEVFEEEIHAISDGVDEVIGILDIFG